MLKIKDEKNGKTPKIIAPLTFEEKISKSVGSMTSLYIHTAIFLFAGLLILLGVSTEEVLSNADNTRFTRGDLPVYIYPNGCK